MLDEHQRAGVLAGAAVLAYPSLDEGFGFPLLEAMEAGVPVVAAAAGAIPEVAGDAALLVDPLDAAALAAAPAPPPSTTTRAAPASWPPAGSGWRRSRGRGAPTASPRSTVRPPWSRLT